MFSRRTINYKAGDSEHWERMYREFHDGRKSEPKKTAEKGN